MLTFFTNFGKLAITVPEIFKGSLRASVFPILQLLIDTEWKIGPHVEVHLLLRLPL